MSPHTFDISKAHVLEDASRYRYLSRDEVLWALDYAGSERTLDLGSGTGFITDDIAPFSAHVYALDLQRAMHQYYREKGTPENVTLLTARANELPIRSDGVHRVLSTMTYHEILSEQTTQEIARVLAPDGRVVIADWSKNGTGVAGPPLSERVTASRVTDELEAVDIDVVFEATRPETFLVVGVKACIG